MSKITLTVRKADDGLSPASSKKHLLDKQQTLHLQADKHTDFQLADEDGNLPQDIILTQEGEDLLIGQVGEEKAAAVIKDYYVHHAPFPQTPYTPPEALTVANNPQLAEAAEIPLAPSMSTGAGSGLLSSTPTLAGAGIFTGLTATALGVANHKSKKHPSSEQPSPDNGNNTKPTDPAKPDNGGSDTKPIDPAKPDNGGSDTKPNDPAKPDNGGSDTKPNDPAKPDNGSGDTKPNPPATAEGGYTLHDHPVYGKYIDAAEFGTDPTGKTDSLPAIQEALRAAEKESAALKAGNADAKGVFVYLKGTLYVSDQIVIDKKTSHVGGLFGDGMTGRSANGEGTEIRFDKLQEERFNSNTNEMDIRSDAGVLVDGVNGVTIANLSVKYTADDFYREGYSYFGKVNGIVVNDADHTTIRSVEVSGANRAGVYFGSTKTLEKDEHSNDGRTYKARLISGDVDVDYEHLPYGENNRVEDSYMHHNRVAGVMFGYQKDFTAHNNVLERNGHEADGGTGYGIASMAGSYNKGITFTDNKTDHNYRKGLDIHDGNHITIANNQSNGDRLYGIAVYNRQFVMNDVQIKNNTVVQDADFRLEKDDGNLDNFPYEVVYHGYSGIQLMTNTQFRDFNSDVAGKFTVSGNTLKGLDVYKDNIQTFGIEFRNHESKTDYRVDITDNVLEGASTKSLIAVINNTKNRATGELGEGMGTVNISGNKAHVDEIAAGRSAIVVAEDQDSHGDKLRGSVTVKDNEVVVEKENYGDTESVYIRANAKHYDISGNELTSNGEAKHSFIVINNDTSHKATAEVNGNHLHSTTWDSDTGGKWSRWLTKTGGEVDLQSAEGNTHNGAKAPLLAEYQAEVDSHKVSLVSALEKHDGQDHDGLFDAGSRLGLSDLLSPQDLGGSGGTLSDFHGSRDGQAYYSSDAVWNEQVLPSTEGLNIL